MRSYKNTHLSVGKFLAERIGLEPMDQKFRSQISNRLLLDLLTIFYNRLQQKATDFCGFYKMGYFCAVWQFVVFFVSYCTTSAPREGGVPPVASGVW